jgi:hypothetical protein
MRAKAMNVFAAVGRIGCVLAVALATGCATGVAQRGQPPVELPSEEDLRRLIAAELASDSRFDSFAATNNAAAQRMAANFSPVLSSLTRLGCRAASAASVDCTVEIVLQFPRLGGKEARAIWERRLRLGPDGWQLVTRALP